MLAISWIKNYDSEQISNLVNESMEIAQQSKCANYICEMNFFKSTYYANLYYEHPDNFAYWDFSYACIKEAEKELKKSQNISMYVFGKVLQAKVDCLLRNTKKDYTNELYSILNLFDNTFTGNDSPRFKEDKLLLHYLVNKGLYNYDEAINDLLEMIKIFPSWLYYNGLATLYKTQGNYEKHAEALQAYQKWAT